MQGGRESAVHTENFRRDYGSDGETVENVDKRLPCLDIASSLALVIETIHSSDIGTFVITTEEKEILWILDLVTKKK